jgi:Ca2+-binding RTX toxin-like protein
MQFPSRRTRIALLAGCATLGLTGTANAAVTSGFDVTTKRLAVTGDGVIDITITCNSDDEVEINGDAPVRSDGSGDPTLCTEPLEIAVTEPDNATGGTTIDLGSVTKGDFTAVASTSISAGAGEDTIVGSGVADAIDPGDANDTVSARGGNDTITWNPGDDSDLMDGDGGVDTVRDNGGGGDETFVVKPNDGDPTRVDATRTSAPAFTLDIEAEKLDVNGNGGNDTITGQNGVAGLTKVTMTGGDGNDVLVGTDGDDAMKGGAGNDSLTGARGQDDKAGDDGDDTLIWRPGDGSDKFEGGAGNDVAQDNGGGAAEHFVISANGQRVTATRDTGAPFFLDIGTSETLDLNANGGDDSVDVNDGLGALIKVDADLGDGNDSIKARNDSAQAIDGGAGTDSAVVDATDAVSNVETVDAPVVTPPPANDAKAPKAAIESRRLKVDGGRAKVRFTVPSDEDRVDARIRILRGGKIVGSAKLAGLEGGDTRTARVLLKRKTRVALAQADGKQLRVTLKIRLTDAAGNKATATRQLNLKG